MQFTRPQLLKIIGFFAAIIVVGLIIYALIPRATIVFAVAPQEIIVVINGNEQTVRNGQSVTVAPGEIILELKREEFAPTGETFFLENGDSREVLVALEPLTDAARQLLLNNGSQLIIQRIGGQNVEQGAAEIEAQFPIIADLPINERFYTIVPCESERSGAEADDLAVCVRLFNLSARQSALEDIERRGYTLADYEIIIQDRTFEATQEQAGE